MKQKKGISLIVLVVVIIVMLIISGAVIISLTNTEIIDMGENAVQKHNEQSVEEAINLAYQDLMVTNLGKVQGYELAERLETLSETYTEIQNITPGNGKVYYTLSLTGKEYQISATTGEIKEYIDSYETVEGYASDWIRDGSTITGYKGENLKDVIVPNVLKDENGNEVKITNVRFTGIDFQGKLIISNDLTIVCEAFSNCANLKEIEIGNGVKFAVTMHSNAYNSPFSNCINLEKVIMGRNIEIDSMDGNIENAKSCILYNCPNLKEVTIESIAKTESLAFVNMQETLKGEIIIVEGVESISNNAFAGCKNITSISLPSTLTSIGADAFNGCSRIQGEIVLNDNIKLGRRAFNYCNGITKLKIGNGVTIEVESFIGCEGLEQVEIGDNVHLEVSQFYNVHFAPFSNCTNLEKVIIGQDMQVYAVDNGASNSQANIFYNCPKLKEMTIESISRIEKTTFTNVKEALNGKVIINEGVESISNNAFAGCKNITNISLPSTLTTIGTSAFYNCTGVNSLSINMTSEAFESVTKGSNWNTGIPVDITYIEAATN